MEQWVCGTCGYDGMRAEFTSTLEVAAIVFCPVPGCRGEMHRPGLLAEIDGSVASRLTHDDFVAALGDTETAT